jgi:hypothetical protein
MLNEREKKIRKRKIITYCIIMSVLAVMVWIITDPFKNGLVWFLLGYFLAETRVIIFARQFNPAIQVK